MVAGSVPPRQTACLSLSGRAYAQRGSAVELHSEIGSYRLDCLTELHRVIVGGDTSYHRCGLMARLLRRGRSRAGSRALSAGRHRAVRA
jgi:hypothetical protein